MSEITQPLSSGTPTASSTTDAAASQRMDPALKARWLEALRSGRYQQCKRALHDGNGFCCIGVYGAVMNVPRDVMREYPSAVGSYNEDTLPLQPLESIGGVMVRHKLADMNDSGKSFSEIADWIEANL